MACLTVASATLVGAQTLQTVDNTIVLPRAALTLGSNGNFYGTTAGGGWGYGTVFQMKPNGQFINTFYLGSESYSGGNNVNSSNGAGPVAALTLGTDGNFYGTTPNGGSFSEPYLFANGDGTVFKYATNGAFTSLVSFNLGNMEPEASLTLGNDGNFYGTTKYGGAFETGEPSTRAYLGYGTVFRVTTNGTLTTLSSFNFTNGSFPLAALTLGIDGIFYGTATSGGITNSTNPYGLGTVFKVTTNGTLTVLASFSGTNGANPQSALTLGTDGIFYGTTPWSSGNNGAVFRVTTNGELTTLVSFSGTNGASPVAALTLGTDGNFYGTTEYGGNEDNYYYNGGWGYGTVFKVTTNGTLTMLFSFSGTNGANPLAALTLGNDGNFYGTTAYGGITNSNPYGLGTVFRLLLPPVINVQPQNLTNYAGSTVMFTVSATSLNLFGYQWQKNGANLVDGGNISGSATNTLTITGISDSDAASYSVIVSNANFGVTSSNATLTVIDPPTLALQFSSGYPQLNLAGMLSNNFIVQYSTNLTGTNWINLLSLSNLSASPYLFLDPAGIVPPSRFYRAVMLP
jgi:uncharacterized repeat protein (TIGR03803 family)